MPPSNLNPYKQLKEVKLVDPPTQIEDPNEFFSKIKDPPLLRLQITFNLKLSKSWETFKIYKFLGGGSEGEVYECLRLHSTDAGDISSTRHIAIKFVKNPDRNKEIDILESIPSDAYDHKNVVRYRAFARSVATFFKPEFGPRTLKPVGLVIMDVARHGSLVDWILRRHRSGRLHFPDQVAKRILRDLVDGMNHLRSHGVSHRDLKGDNIFLDCQGRFVIGDFGHCIIDETHARGNNFKVAEALGSFGTTEYNPPESFAVNAKTLVNPEKVDVFQLGTVLFSIFTGVCIWQINCGYFKRTDLDLDPRHNSTENKKFWDKWEEFRSRPSIIQHLGHASPISEEAKKLLNRMLSYDPEYRPTFSELLDAMYGRGDNSLQWLSGLKGTCSLEELYEELHERIADDSQEEIARFLDTQQRWNRAITKLNCVGAFSSSSGKFQREMTGKVSNVPGGDSDCVQENELYNEEQDCETLQVSRTVTVSTDDDRKMFETVTNEMLSDSAKDPMFRPVLKWYLNMHSNLDTHISDFVETLIVELKRVFSSLLYGDTITGENPVNNHYDCVKREHETCWGVDCELHDAEGYAILGFTMKLDVHTNDHGEFNGTLGVRRNFGNGLDLEAHLLSVFDSSELQRHWKLCPNSQQPLAPMPHIKGVAKPWASLLRDILPVKIMTSGWGLLRGIVTKISSSFENQAESSVLSEVEVEPALKRRK